MKSKSVLFLFVALIFAGCKTDDIIWLNGQWEGVGCQLDLEENNTWSISLEVDVYQQLFEIQYPSLECSGQWELVEYSNDRAVFNELILENTNTCIKEGTVIITKVDENHISFSYYIIDGEDVLAFSTLKRKRDNNI
ncbi:hypothetical protein ATO12_03725 [Aquimarina atlantica]|uniref:Lipocalin-like domain-containing protein n=1 Tax=Aquimarina atlantica TaxID=1317122 RepID=A0A023C0S0_9FLAO|nr:hypothetical protein [Aquimarina atlantica]EZH75912.1 hypothetical protein ATO12_03725 [Aquimarina atlantica]